MSKLKYGPRFRSGAVSVGCRYSEFLGRVPPQFQRMTPKQRAFAAAKQSVKITKKRIVGMPKFSWGESRKAADNERAEAERRATERIRLAVQSLKLSLDELARIPNPSGKFENHIDQRALSDVLPRLCRCVHPPLVELSDDHLEIQQQQPRVAEICISCGEPGPFPYGGEWYCDSCIDDAHKAA